VYCRGIKYDHSFGQNTRLKKKLDTTCKHNATEEIPKDNKTTDQKTEETTEETAGYVRPERVKKWPKSLIAK
jgi:hypothetical protein